MELFLDPNGDQIKLRWRSDSAGSRGKPLLLPKNLLMTRAQEIRDDLTALSRYVGRTDLNADRDPGWAEYGRILGDLRDHGRALYRALFDFRDPRAVKLAAELEELPAGAELKIHCSDEQVTLPLGFVFCSGRANAPTAVTSPCRTDFHGFWLDRFRLSLLIEGSRCQALDIDPATFRSLYALHRGELEAIEEHLGIDRERLALLLSKIDFKEAYFDWKEAERAYDQFADWNQVVFVFAHSDGDWLMLDGSKIDSSSFTEMLQRNKPETQTTLVILNCCLSLSGDEHCSLLRSVSADGFCGVIGTEAEILNTYAMRCGTRLMWGLCAHGQSLGESFESMQRDIDLFPLNLLYTCYADRRFRLTQPFASLELAA
jgi:hypothetical protein